jgi:hypothetical protein
MFSEYENHPKYDFPTAVTFLLIGVGVGWTIGEIMSAFRPEEPFSRRSVLQPESLARAEVLAD